MPFVTQALRSYQSIQPPFVGREAERHFFSQQVLSPDEPQAHLIRVWGPAGVGVSSLLAQWSDDARTQPFKGGCLTAIASGRIGSPLRVMATWAAQLRAAGAPLVAFEQMFKHMTTTLVLPYSVEQQAARSIFVHRVRDLVNARPLQGFPVIGELYETVGEAARSAFLSQYPAYEIHEDQDFQARLAIVTRAFLEDLNWLATTPVQPTSRRGLRIVLLLDDIGPAASSLFTWLRTQIFSASLNIQIVLVLAGHEPLDHLLAEEQGIRSLPLQPFTEDETRRFLEASGITDQAQVKLLWQRTGGLPLALRILMTVPFSWLNVEGSDEDAIRVGMRWIEQQEPGYRYLVRYAALFSRSFRQQDLSVCPMFTEQDLIEWYRRLIALPFVRSEPLTGDHAYHPLVQRQVNLHFANEERFSYLQARQALARYYQRQLETLKRSQGEAAMTSAAGRKLILASIEQWLWLSDEPALRQVIEQSLQMIQHTADHADLLYLLRTFVQEELPERMLSPRGRRVAELLLIYSEADLSNPTFIGAMTELLELVGPQASISAALRARLYGRRAAARLLQDQQLLALEDCTAAVALDPDYADGYLLQGIAMSAPGTENEVIAVCDRVLTLDVRSVFGYGYRGLARMSRRAYEQAAEDANRMMNLAPDLAEAGMLRGLIYKVKGGLHSIDYQLEQTPDNKDAYVLQGMAYCALGQYERALRSFERALAFDPNDPRIYAGRGHLHLERGDLERARQDLARSWELDPRDGATGLLLAWVRVCQEMPDSQMSAWLETFAAGIPQQDIALVCQGITLITQKQFERALGVLEQAQQTSSRDGSALFWKALAHMFLKQDAEALTALDQARHAEFPLPVILFTPLRWIAMERADFYREHLQPLLRELKQPIQMP